VVRNKNPEFYGSVRIYTITLQAQCAPLKAIEANSNIVGNAIVIAMRGTAHIASNAVPQYPNGIVRLELADRGNLHSPTSLLAAEGYVCCDIPASALLSADMRRDQEVVLEPDN
jgi:hypothetical protein